MSDTNEFEFDVLTEALNKFIASYGEENLPAGFLDLTKSFQSHNIDIQDWNSLVTQVSQSISNSNTCKEFLVELTEFVKGYLSHTYTTEQIDEFLDLKANKSEVYSKTETYNRSDADARFVHSTGDESVSGVKTFNNVPKTLGNPSANTDLETVKHVSDNYVGLNRSEHIGGTKIHDVIPEINTGLNYDPSNLNQLASMEKVKDVQDNVDEETSNRQSADALLIPKSQKGQANGVATLDENGKLPLNQLTDIALGQLTKGGEVTGSGFATLTTNAKIVLGTDLNQIQLLNTPEGITGYLANQLIYYVMSSDGSFANLDLKVGDWLVANASGWSKIDNTDAVSSVNGETGAVIITKSHLGLQYIETDIAPLYDENTSYIINDLVIYEDKLYKCISPTTGTFDTTKWSETNIKTLLKTLPQYVDLTILPADNWALNTETNRYELSKSTGVLDLTNDDTVLALPNGKESDAYIRTFDIVEESFDNTTGNVTFSCAIEPTEIINITLQILRR